MADANNLHRYLHVPVEYTPVFPKLKNPIEQWDQFPIAKHEVNDQIHSWLNSIGLEFVMGAVFYLPPGHIIKPHTDRPFPKGNTYTKINWVYNGDVYNNIEPAEHNMMEWFDIPVDAEPFLAKVPTGREYYDYSKIECTKIFEAKMHRPSLVNIGAIHGTHNLHKTTWYFCVMVKEIGKYDLINWSEAQEIFKDYIATE